MASHLTVYTKSLSPCGQCDMTLNVAEKEGVPVVVLPGIDTPEHAPLLAYFKEEHGLLSAPIVEAFVDGLVVDRWAGFRPDKIKEHA